LDRLLYLGKSGAFTRGAFDFCNWLFIALHKICTPKMGSLSLSQPQANALAALGD